MSSSFAGNGSLENKVLKVQQGPYALGKFFFFQKYLSSVLFYKCEQHFLSYQNVVKPYQTSKAPLSVSKEDKFFSSVKTVRFLQFAGLEMANSKFGEIFVRAKKILVNLVHTGPKSLEMCSCWLSTMLCSVHFNF